MASDAVVNLVVNADGAQAMVNAQLRTIVNDAERNAPSVDLRVDLDLAATNRIIQRELGILGTRLDLAIGHLGDRLEDINNQLSLDLRSTLQGVRDDIQSMNSAGSNITNVTNNFNNLRDEVDDTDRSTSRLSDTFSSLGRTAFSAASSVTRVFLTASLATQAIPAVAALGASLANLAPAATAGVAAFLTMKAVSATLKLGLTGVSDAVNAVFDPNADPEAVAEAMKNLSTNARAFVGVLQRLRPAFDDLRLDVQDRLFRNLDTTLERTARTVFPEIRRAALDYAGTLNQMAQGAGSAARAVDRDGSLGQALRSSTDAFSNLERIPGQVLAAIVRLAAAGGPLLGRITDRLADFVDSASVALERAFQSGALEDAVDGAADAFSQLGRIAGNVFGTLGNIFSVASEQGDGLFGTLEKITQAMEDFTGSDAFQDALGALIETGGVLVDSILPVIEEAFKALLPVIEELAPPVQEIVSLLGEKLAELIPELAPVLLELATVFGTVLEAITPLIEEGINLLIELMPVLVPLLEAIGVLFEELSPLIEYFAVGAKELLVPALTVAIEFFTYFVIGLAEIIKWVDEAIKWLVQFADGAVKNVLVPAVQIAVAVLRGDWSTAWGIAKEATREAAVSITDYTLEMGTGIVGLLKSMFVQSTGWFVSGFNQFKQISFAGVNYIIQQVYRLRDWTLETVYGLAGQLYSAGANMITSLANGILSQLGSAVSAAQEVVGAIRDFFPSSPAKKGPFSGRGYTLYSGQALMDAFGRGIESRRSSVQRSIALGLGDGINSPLLRSSGLVSASASDPRAFGGISTAGLTFTRLMPNINVYLGNEQFRDYVQTVVDEDTAQQNRLAAQGVRSN